MTLRDLLLVHKTDKDKINKIDKKGLVQEGEEWKCYSRGNGEGTTSEGVTGATSRQIEGVT